ncbi:MAG: arylsulfatase [Actinomyces sp.]|nr:MAG: arylsulfatase [Actinomyces sp.]
MSTPPRSERGAALRRGEVTPDPGPARRALPDWQGRLGRTLAESEPHWPAPPHPGEDAPNLVLIVLDDTGFAHLGCYGSTIDTRHLDALAGRGLRYTNFHVTPLCSPTRAALLTGRNHHEVGMRAVSNFDTGFPNMLGHISDHACTLAEVLHDAGWATFAVGKWHLAPIEQCSAAGPWDQWPCQRGFDRFYGFLEGETDQFNPQLVADNHPIEPPARPEDGYHLSEDLVDRAIGMIHDARSVRPDRPFFCYLAFGATHAPHQAPAAYLDRYRGAFDEGWDVMRERWFARQVEMGLLPPGTELAPRNPGVKAWVELDEDERRLALRLQEAFAAFLDHTDDQIGRLLADLEASGELDDTIVVVVSDNGASQEGGPFGVLHEMKFFNGILETPAEAVAHLDEIGGPHSHANYPWGWAQAGNTPFRWYKQDTHEGGVHVPFIVAGDRLVPPAARGGVRHQFQHVNDVAVTLYEVLGIEPPTERRGLPQMPLSGTSFAASFADPDAPSTKHVQYFEMAGKRGIWHEGWKAVCRHRQGDDYDTERWELYHVAVDPSECHDLADAEPERLEALIDLWWQEAEAHGVLPLDDRMIELFGVRFRERSPHPPDRHYVYRPPLSPMPGQAGAAIGGRGFDLLAAIERGPGDEGVLFATGTENAGLSLFVQGDRLVFDYNAFDDHTVIESTRPVPLGASVVGVEVRRDGRRGTARLLLDGEPDTAADLPLFMSTISSVGPSVGYDHGSAVSRRYTAPFPFTGALHRVDILLSPDRRPADAVTRATAEMRAEMSRQ